MFLFSPNTTAALQRVCDALLLSLIPWFLAVDCLNGALLQSQGSSYGLSMLYKAILLLLMLLALVLQRPLLLLAWLGALLLLLSGPAMHWAQLPLSWLVADVQLAVKVLSPLLALAYLLLLRQRLPDAAVVMFRRSFYISAVVLAGNLLAGLAGLGYTAYQPLDGVAQSFLGIKGFFYSANELAIVLLVVSCVLLVQSWPVHKGRYVVIATGALAFAVQLLTKTGLFGVMLLTLLVPLLMQPLHFWRQRRNNLMMIGLLLLLTMVMLLSNAEPILRLLGIYDKLSFVYQQRGITGILLSSRDYYADRIWHTIAGHYNDWQRIAGVGQGPVAILLKKYFAELDWFDLVIFYGVAGLLAFLSVFAWFFHTAWQQRQSGAGRCLLLLNLLLLSVSSLAGHVLTSGMLWLPWALANALLLDSVTTDQRPADERST